MNCTEEVSHKAAVDAYKKGDVRFYIESDKCALLVIDMQEEFVKPCLMRKP